MPHSPQNSWDAGTSAPQCAHRTASGDPQSPQKRCPAGLRAPAEEDDPDVATTKLLGGVSDLAPDEATAAYVGGRLGRLLGLTYPGAGEIAVGRDELFAGWRLFFELLASRSPVVLLVEDAERADAGVLEFLDVLVDWTRDLPIFVLVFARPEIPAGPLGWGIGRNRTVLTLDPLHSDAMSDLLLALVPGMPPEAVREISEQARGVPLFAVETIRSLVDRDVVVATEGRYRLIGELGELSVPDSLHGLLAARLDALDPSVRAVVADAAVLGATFTPDGLAAVAGRPQADVAGDLEVLIRRGVLEIEIDPLSPQRGTYRFAHQMVRQVAYGTLSRRERRGRHLAVAAHLRRAFPGDGEEVVDVVAQHYLDALAAVPDASDAVGVRREALASLRRAAARAERTGAPLRAAATSVTAAELAASSGEPPEVVAVLWEAAADSAVVGGAYGAGMEHAERGAALFLAAGERRAAARCRGMAGFGLGRGGRVAEARTILEASLEVLRERPDHDTALLLGRLGVLEVFEGNEVGLQLIFEGMGLGQVLGLDPGDLSELFSGYGVGLHFRGRDLEAVLYLREAARLAEVAGNHRMVGSSLANLSDLLTTADPAAGAAVARESMEHASRAGDLPCLEIAAGNLCSALLMLGRWDEAAAVLADTVSRLAGGPADAATGMTAWLAALRGDGTGALQILTGLSTLGDSENSQDRSGLAGFRAFAQHALGDDAAALSLAREALEARAMLGISADHLRWAWPLAARCARRLDDREALGELLAMLDEHSDVRLAPMQRAERELVRATMTDDDETVARVERAVEGMRTMSTPYHLGLALLDLAALVETTDPERAALAAREAEAIGDRLHCLALRERAGRWLRSPSEGALAP